MLGNRQTIQNKGNTEYFKGKIHIVFDVTCESVIIHSNFNECLPLTRFFEIHKGHEMVQIQYNNSIKETCIQNYMYIYNIYILYIIYNNTHIIYTYCILYNMYKSYAYIYMYTLYTYFVNIFIVYIYKYSYI